MLPPYSWWKEVFHNPAAVDVTPSSLLGASFSFCATHYVCLLVSATICSIGFSAFSLTTYTVREGVDWIDLGRDRGYCGCRNEPSGFIKLKEFFD